ncbi:MAG: accessory gene regulator B family protein [Erysipelotrichaceae bacterium]
MCRNSDIIQDNELELITYGLEVFLFKLVLFCIVAFVGIISNTLPEAIIYFISFMWLRMYCGGYHASNYRNCLILSSLLYIVLVVLLNLLNINIVVVLVSSILSIIVIWKYSPQDTLNKILNKEEKKRNKHISILIAILYIIIIIVSYNFKYYKISYSIAYALIVSSMMLFPFHHKS